MKIWRRLQNVGAITVKNALYVLPSNDQTREDFDWILKEIIHGGAEGAILEAQFIEGMDDNQIKGIFDQARDNDFEILAEEINEFKENYLNPKQAEIEFSATLETQVTRFKKKLWDIDTIDFFGANGRETVDGLILNLENFKNQKDDKKEETITQQKNTRKEMLNKIWVTRQNVHVDRIASAWLVKKWIDENAKFKFTPDKRYQPVEGEVRYDMFDAEYTHEGDKCTFEVLLERAKLDDPALIRIGEIIHDIDLKDGKYGHEETSGIALLIQGLSATETDDMERIKKGGEIFMNLHQIFTTKKL